MKKSTVEGCFSVGTTFFKKHGYFCGRQMTGAIIWKNSLGQEIGSIRCTVSVSDGAGSIRFQYMNTNRLTGQHENLDYTVRVVSTRCNYGNLRWWFICPIVNHGVPCQNRVFKLYFGDGKHLGCRHCYNLTYASCQKHDKRVDKLLKDPTFLLRAIDPSAVITEEEFLDPVCSEAILRLCDPKEYKKIVKRLYKKLLSL